MHICSIRQLNFLVCVVLMVFLGACATTNTGSEAGQTSTAEVVESAGDATEEIPSAPVEVEQEALVFPDNSSAAPLSDDSAEALMPDVIAQPEPLPIDEVTTSSVAPIDAVEPVAEFPEQTYSLDETQDAEESRADAEIERLREELAKTESELESLQEEAADRDYATREPESVDSGVDEAAMEPAVGETVQPETFTEENEPPVSAEPPAPIDTAAATNVSPPAQDDTPARPTEFSIYFDYDQSTFNDHFESVIRAHVEYLKAHADVAVEIQGNCDERGSREYNIALGQRRANSVKRALEILGVDGSRIVAVSFGSEKPIAYGRDEESWRLNRRADIVY